MVQRLRRLFLDFRRLSLLRPKFRPLTRIWPQIAELFVFFSALFAYIDINTISHFLHLPLVPYILLGIDAFRIGRLDMIIRKQVLIFVLVHMPLSYTYFKFFHIACIYLGPAYFKGIFAHFRYALFCATIFLSVAESRSISTR